MIILGDEYPDLATPPVGRVWVSVGVGSDSGTDGIPVAYALTKDGVVAARAGSFGWFKCCHRNPWNRAYGAWDKDGTLHPGTAIAVD